MKKRLSITQASLLSFVSGSISTILCLMIYANWFFVENEPTQVVHYSQEDFERSPAREWLKTNRNETALAASRFGSTAEALEYVERLYELGADEVFVAGIHAEPIRFSEEKGPYATSLYVKLPVEPEKRKALFLFTATEFTREGLSPETDSGQGSIFLWWD